MRRVYTFLIMSPLLFASGCGYFTDNRDSKRAPDPAVFGQRDLNYESVKQILFSQKCERCHNERNPARGLDLSTYELVFANRYAIERSVFRERSMPPRTPLSGRDTALLRAWLNAGLPRGSDSGGGGDPVPKPAPPVERADFTYIRDVIFAKHACFKCHAVGSFPSDIPLDTVEDLTVGPFAVVVPGRPSESKLLDILETTDRHRMPPVSSDDGLSPAEVKLIRDWIERGAKATE